MPIPTLAVAVLTAATPLLAQNGSLKPPPAPSGNPVTAEKAMLGKALFWDEQLSSTRTVACGTCHLMPAGGSDPRAVLGDPRSTHPGPDGLLGTPDDVAGSPGVTRSDASGLYVADALFSLQPQVTGRRSMPVINAAYGRDLFWDGRASEQFVDPLTQQVVLSNKAGLESQALGPPTSEVEMAHQGRDWTEVAARVAVSQPLALAESVPSALDAWVAGRDYPALFAEAFGDPAVTPVRIAFAIATYQRTLYSDQAPIDAFLDGDANALTAQEKRGFDLFRSSRLSCDFCHGAPVFSDQKFHYIGVRPQGEDPGRGGVTGDPKHEGLMKTPSLRNVELRPPYFHGGSAATLEEVVDLYDRGGDFTGSNLANQIQPLNLTPEERADLLAFLRRPLTDPRVAAGAPPFDAPVLYAQSGRVARPYGTPTAGTSGDPVFVADEPALLGNPALTLGLDRAWPGANALLILDFTSDEPGSLVRGARCHLALTPAQIRYPVALGAQGTGSVVLQVPASAGLAGITVYAQWFFEDPGAPAGVAATDARAITLFPAR